MRIRRIQYYTGLSCSTCEAPYIGGEHSPKDLWWNGAIPYPCPQTTRGLARQTGGDGLPWAVMEFREYLVRA